MIVRPLRLPSLVFAKGGFFIAVWGLLWGSVGVWDFLHEIPCKPSFIVVGAFGGVALMVDGLAGGWIEPALDGGSIFDAAILAISSMPYAGGEGVEYLSTLCLLRTFRERLFNAPPNQPLFPYAGGEGVRCINALFGGFSCRSVGFVWGVVGLCLLRDLIPFLNILDAPLFVLV